ncbi:MAG TPA: alpha/beta hydrolase-fold protein, partial [Longimicrobiales bacterium]
AGKRCALVVLAALAALAGPARAQAPGGRPAQRSIDPRKTVAAGRVLEYLLHDRQYERDRRIYVYTPPGYSADRPAYGLIVAFDGPDYLDTIPLPLMLDTLQAARRIPPLVAVLVDDSSGEVRIADLGNRAKFATFLGEELMPWVRSHWHVTRDPARTIVTGSSAGGLAAAFAAFKRPDLFGNVLSQSGAFWRGEEASNDPPYEWLTRQYALGPKWPIRFFLDVGGQETRGALGGSAPSIRDANRRFRQVLLTRQYDVRYFEVPDGQHAPQYWRKRLPNGIVALAGKSTAAGVTRPH